MASASTLAAGMCGFAIGSDSAGSVRLPAALCGLVGFKPSMGIWSTDGVFSLSPTFDTVGTLTWSVSDAIRVFAALTGQAAPTPPAASVQELGHELRKHLAVLQSVSVLREGGRIPGWIVGRKPDDPAAQKIVVQLFHELSFRPNAVEHLEQQCAQQLLRRDRGPSLVVRRCFASRSASCTAACWP